MLYFSSIISGIILGFFWVTLKSIILEFSSIMYLTLVHDEEKKRKEKMHKNLNCFFFFSGQ